MSEHRRKPPQPQGGGRAAARRAAQQPPGRRAAPPHSASGSASAPHGEERPYGGRAAARRAAQQGGRRRAADPGGGRAGHGGHGGRRGGGGGGRGRGPGGGPPGKKRFIDYPRAGRYGWHRWVPSWKLVTGTCLCGIGFMVAFLGIALLVVQVPNAQAAAKTQKNVYYWGNGKRMVVSGGGNLNRQIVQLSDIPNSMQNAVISAENSSFYQDSGVDPEGIARAVVNMAKGGETQGGSTITQQYVKNTYLSQQQTIKRKLTELLISIKVGWKESKSDILAGYLNTAYYGRGAYGIQAASQAYYGKDCDKLNPSESAFLAATVNGPNIYDPAGGIGTTPQANLKRAKARWAWILQREVDTHRLSQASYEHWIKKKFPMPEHPKTATNKAGQIGYLTDLADNYITANTNITKAELDKGGYQIHTTFDPTRMKQLEGSIKKVREQNIKPKQRSQDKYVQFGGASVQPRSGKILAIYGGTNALKHYTDNADYTGVQVGSTFKPFVLAAALRDGARDPKGPPDQDDSMRTPVSPKSMFNGNNKAKLYNYDGSVWHDKDGKEWHQPNDGGESLGRISLRTAMQFSVNSPYIQLGWDVGVDKVEKAALDAGLSKSQLAALTPTFSLGTSAPSAIRMAGAYATFAASGQQIDPYSVSTVEKRGAVVFNHADKAKLKQAFPADVADTVTDVLRTVVEKGTGTSAQIGRPAAGKTGTTDSNKSAWFTGYTPQLSTSIGMWRVNDHAAKQKFLSMHGVGGQVQIHGASYPAQIWAAYMKQALAGQPVKNFPVPPPLGKVINGFGASPSPTTSAPTTTPSDTPSDSSSPTPTGQPTGPTATDTCDPFDPQCQAAGGANGGPGGTGGDNGGGGQTSQPPGGNDNGGGIFGGADGYRRKQ